MFITKGHHYPLKDLTKDTHSEGYTERTKEWKERSTCPGSDNSPHCLEATGSTVSVPTNAGLESMAWWSQRYIVPPRELPGPFGDRTSLFGQSAWACCEPTQCLALVGTGGPQGGRQTQPHTHGIYRGNGQQTRNFRSPQCCEEAREQREHLLEPGPGRPPREETGL